MNTQNIVTAQSKRDKIPKNKSRTEVFANNVWPHVVRLALSNLLFVLPFCRRIHWWECVADDAENVLFHQRALVALRKFDIAFCLSCGVWSKKVTTFGGRLFFWHLWEGLKLIVSASFFVCIVLGQISYHLAINKTQLFTINDLILKIHSHSANFNFYLRVRHHIFKMNVNNNIGEIKEFVYYINLTFTKEYLVATINV